MTPEQIAYLASLRHELNRGGPTVDIPPGESRELGLIFQLPWEEGCWIATPGMAWPPSKQDPAYLAPGQHLVALRLGYSDSAGRRHSTRQQYKVFSPAMGQTLRVEEHK